MRIASLKPMLDGQLVIVEDDGETCRRATDATLRIALREEGVIPFGDPIPFSAKECCAPLPNAAQFLDGSAYVNHVDLVRRARGAAMPASFWTDPLMYQGCASFMGPQDDIAGQADWGIDFEAEIAVITRDVPMGVTAECAASYIVYVMLLNDVSLRNLIAAELSKGFGFVQSKPASACSPMAVTPDELAGWDGRKLHGVLKVDLNGQPFGRADAGQDMTFDFGDLIAHAAKTRHLPAGTIIGSGTISNQGMGGDPGQPIAHGGIGYSCIAEQRMVETLQAGSPETPFLQDGDTVRIWMDDSKGISIFGDIEQTVKITV